MAARTARYRLTIVERSRWHEGREVRFVKMARASMRLRASAELPQKLLIDPILSFVDARVSQRVDELANRVGFVLSDLDSD